MDTIQFGEFYEKFSVKRNPINQTSNFENTMIDFDESGEELLDEVPQQNIWTVTSGSKGEGLVLNPGVLYKNDTIGFFICKKKWDIGEKNYILNY